MCLVRRFGPLLEGVALERDSTNESYRPTFFVHNLGDLTLTLAQPLLDPRGRAPETIAVSLHERKYKDAAARLASQSPLPLEGPVRLDDVLAAYRARLQSPATHFEPSLYEDMALLAAWNGRSSDAKRILDEGYAAFCSWPAAVQSQLGGADLWAHSLRARLADPDGLRHTADAEAKLLEVSSIPTRELE